jgi:phosphoglycolate phosphatase-like HAD superfamily hydrolase
LIVFDFDGTLVDSMPKLRELATYVLQDHFGLSPKKADDQYMLTVGRSFMEQLNIISPRSLRENINAAAAFYEKQVASYETVLLHTGVIDTIEFLNGTDIKYAICSSTTDQLVKDVIGRLLPEFRGKILGREFGPKFTQLQSLVHATDAPDRWFIGDTPFDGQMARQAKARFVGVTHTFPALRFEEPYAASIPQAVDEVLRASLGPVQISTEAITRSPRRTAKQPVGG